MSIVEAIQGVLVAGLFLSLLMMVPLWGPEAVFGKFTHGLQAREDRGLPPFSLADGLVLFGHLAVTNSLAMILRGSVIPVGLLLLTGCANLLVVLIWLKCQRFLWVYGITRPRSRCLMQAVLYPASIFFVAALVGSGVVLIYAWGILLMPAAWQAFSHGPLVVLTITFFLSLGVLAGVRHLFCRSIVLDAACTPQQKTEENAPLSPFE